MKNIKQIKIAIALIIILLFQSVASAGKVGYSQKYKQQKQQRNARAKQLRKNRIEWLKQQKRLAVEKANLRQKLNNVEQSKPTTVDNSQQST